jgi:hypothetical protein
MVIVFKMKDSDKLIREQAEVAFDEVFGDHVDQWKGNNDMIELKKK